MALPLAAEAKRSLQLQAQIKTMCTQKEINSAQTHAKNIKYASLPQNNVKKFDENEVSCAQRLGRWRDARDHEDVCRKAERDQSRVE